MADTETPSGEQPSIEQFSDLEEDFIFPRGLEGDSIITFVKYLSGWSSHDRFMRLYAVFGEDLLLFLSIFQGEALRIPPMGTLQKIKSYCSIYSFLKKRGFTDEAYSQCERQFHKKRYHLQRIVAKVERVMKRLDPKRRGVASG